MSNNIFIEKNFYKIAVTNIFSSLIQNNKWDMLIEMFKLNILDINIRDNNGKNALYWAMKYKKNDIIKKLLELNISPMVSSSLTAINYAVYLNDVRLLKCLKDSGLDIDEKDEINSTPLINAVLYNKQNCIKYLIQNGADINHEDFLGNSANTLLKI